MKEEDAQEILDEVEGDTEKRMRKDGYLEIRKKKNYSKNTDRRNIGTNTKKMGVGLVKEAVSDLEKEISRIRKEKSTLNFELKNIDDSLENAHHL